MLSWRRVHSHRLAGWRQRAQTASSYRRLKVNWAPTRAATRRLRAAGPDTPPPPPDRPWFDSVQSSPHRPADCVGLVADCSLFSDAHCRGRVGESDHARDNRTFTPRIAAAKVGQQKLKLAKRAKAFAFKQAAMASQSTAGCATRAQGISLDARRVPQRSPKAFVQIPFDREKGEL
jgi:hypothetical protein